MDHWDAPGIEGIIDVDDNSSESFLFQLRHHIKNSINTCSEKIKLILSRFGVSKDLSFLSKKFEDPFDLLRTWKSFYPSVFIFSQVGNTNEVDDSTSSDDSV